MATVYDIVTTVCFACVALTYFMFKERGMKSLGHFVLPAIAFAFANQVGNAGIRADSTFLNVLAILLIAAGIGYTYMIVKR